MQSLAAVGCGEPVAEAREAPAERVRLSALHPGAAAVVVCVLSSSSDMSPIERRLLELGFVSGERVEVITEARPGRDPFVVRIGATTLALRRRDVDSVWVSLRPPERA
ncbi:MAG TPA: FeoA family protein [Steroidobacteraceae bacterium]|nr:FeoA family protein [Steroidobacteraceae bacterium]